ncbi:MAG: phosphoribosylaminoimidazolesuccinocarboxamide synthase [Candidatus Aminicenantes bacterium]|nr:phosphoribosylaminoimidazolesuccinocarboxamide synthase [Candidatus Aminicenantes bacterium]MDH5385836.1 phosphoribosylaminoimidazolesuccinocarboxamide synthase [Candidatus Aminicenantes bacterium]MDH5742739.1 phosphoribosylaminoimidazolesuccinocarboxamide synthase [Candidatus Aminicenantes bacterium]
MKNTYSEITIPDFPLFKKGKVREVYEVGGNLLIVASDRISAFDWVLPSLIPNKGKILTQLSKFWFEYTELISPNHMITTQVDEYPEGLHKHREKLEKRSMMAKKTKVVPVECVVRGYLAGSGWKEYKAVGKTSGIKLPTGLKQSDRLDEPIFAPATKAEEGHDINISFKEMQKIIGSNRTKKIKSVSLELYQKASLHALSKGIIIADTKFEFGLLNDELILVDEIFTPDSSRFWPVESYSPGRSQLSLDKQFVRDYLEGTDWDKNSLPPPLPLDIVRQTALRYMEIYRLLTDNTEL